MQGTMVIISVDGNRTVTPLNDVPSSEVLRKAVGGYIELVPYWNVYIHDGVAHKCVAFCDEEGKLKRVPVNPTATSMWYKIAPQMANADVLCGPVAIVWGDAEFMSEL